MSVLVWESRKPYARRDQRVNCDSRGGEYCKAGPASHNKSVETRKPDSREQEFFGAQFFDGYRLAAF